MQTNEVQRCVGAAPGVPHGRARDGASARAARARAERGAEPAPRPVPLPLREREPGGRPTRRSSSFAQEPGRPVPADAPRRAPRRPEAAGHRPRPGRRDHRRGLPAASQLSLARARGPRRAARRRRRDASCRGGAAGADPRATTSTLLAGILADRPADAVTVVFQTASTGYLDAEAAAAAARRARRGGRRRAAAGVGLDPEARRAGGLERGLLRARAPRLAGAAAARRARRLPRQLDRLAARVITSRDNETLKLVRKLLDQRRSTATRRGSSPSRARISSTPRGGAGSSPCTCSIAGRDGRGGAARACLDAAASGARDRRLPARRPADGRPRDVPRAVAARRPRQRRHAPADGRRVRRRRRALRGVRGPAVAEGAAGLGRRDLPRPVDAVGRPPGRGASRSSPTAATPLAERRPRPAGHVPPRRRARGAAGRAR